MATLGYKLEKAADDLSGASILHTTRNGVSALGIYSGDKFDVLEGSEINM